MFRIIPTRPVSALLLYIFLAASAAQASTIQSFSLPELIEEAELIFQGRVTDVRVDEMDSLLYSFVRFQVEEVLKGDYPGAELELRFLGGELASRALSVSEMTIPTEGERGVYFVDSLNVDTVNPLLGWTQGHFLIVGNQAGGESVVAADSEETPELTRSKDRVLAEKLQAMKFSSKAVEDKLGGDPSATSLAVFKGYIRDVLEAALP